LYAIDGNSPHLPQFILAPLPDENDKDIAVLKGENYYPQNHKSNVKCNISGSLHDDFYLF
jgi:hypothetical protein